MPALRVAPEVARVHVRLELHAPGAGHVEDHDAADPLEAHEGVGAAADPAEHDALGLGALVVAAGVEALVLLVVRVELRGQEPRGDLPRVLTPLS